jgi:hypothetical protein
MEEELLSIYRINMKFLFNISQKSQKPDLPTENINPVNTCPDFLITEEEVKDKLDILNCTKPSGPDGVAPMILRHVSQSIIKPLTLLLGF